MKNYLLIDHAPSANRQLLQALTESDTGLISTTNKDGVQRLITKGFIKAIFIRAELWDYSWIGKALEEASKSPELVLLCKPGQETDITCDFGMPEILADDATEEEVNQVLNYLNSVFIPVMDYSSIRLKEKEVLELK